MSAKPTKAGDGRPQSPLEAALTQDGEDRIGYRFYSEPIARLLEAMDKGVCPWANPVLAVPMANGKSAVPYGGFNQLYLSAVASAQNLRSPFWLTYKQAEELGGHVRQGARSAIVVYRKVYDENRPAKTQEEAAARPSPKADSEETGNRPAEHRFSRLFYHRVFNVDQTVDVQLGRDPYPTMQPALGPEDASERARAIVAGFKDAPAINHDLGIAKTAAGTYNAATDTISLRRPEEYASAGEYWGSMFHEIIHSCCAERRLNIHNPARFGTPDYALEELTCEIGANLLLVRAGIENEELRSNSAAYLRSWKSKIEQNPKHLVWAAQKAARAVNLVLGVSPEAEVTKPEATEAAVPHEAPMPLKNADELLTELNGGACTEGARAPAVGFEASI